MSFNYGGKRTKQTTQRNARAAGASQLSSSPAKSNKVDFRLDEQPNLDFGRSESQGSINLGFNAKAVLDGTKSKIDESSLPMATDMELNLERSSITNSGSLNQIIPSANMQLGGHRKSMKARAGTSTTSSVSSYIRSLDKYAQPIGLSFEGRQNYGTCTGLILTMMLYAAVVYYGFLRVNDSTTDKPWILTSQTVPVSAIDLTKLFPLANKEYSNLSTSILFKRKRSFTSIKQKEQAGAKQVSEADLKLAAQLDFQNYSSNVQNMTKYLKLFGMVEKKNGKDGTYNVYDSKINPNPYTWKEYTLKPQLNKDNVYEMKLDQNDMVMQGTSDGAEASDEVISRFQIRIDTSIMLWDAYKICKDTLIRIDNITYNDWAARERFDLTTQTGQDNYLYYKNHHKRSTCKEVLTRDAAALLVDFERYLRIGYNQMDAIDRANVDANVTEMKNLYSQGQDKFIQKYYYRYYTEVQLYDQAQLQLKYDQLRQRQQLFSVGSETYRQLDTQMQEYRVQNLTILNKMSVFRQLTNQFLVNMTNHLNNFDIEFVVNDEVENFRDRTSALFDYPYVARRSQLGHYPIFVSDIVLGKSLSGYNYTQVQMNYKLSESCLEGSAESFNNKAGAFSDDFSQQCENSKGQYSQKLMFDKVSSDVHKHDQYYDIGFFNEKIALELRYRLSLFKNVNRRWQQTPQMFTLDLIASLGGIYIILDIILGFFASNLGNRYMSVYVANMLYKTRVKQPNDDKNQLYEGGSAVNSQQIDSKFKMLELSWLHAICAPITCGCGRLSNFCTEVAMYKSARNKLKSQLDVANLLRKVNQSHAMYKSFMSPEQQILSNYGKDFVLFDSDYNAADESDEAGDNIRGSDRYEDLTRRLVAKMCTSDQKFKQDLVNDIIGQERDQLLAEQSLGIGDKTPQLVKNNKINELDVYQATSDAYETDFRSKKGDTAYGSDVNAFGAKQQSKFQQPSSILVSKQKTTNLAGTRRGGR